MYLYFPAFVIIYLFKSSYNPQSAAALTGHFELHLSSSKYPESVSLPKLTSTDGTETQKAFCHVYWLMSASGCKKEIHCLVWSTCSASKCPHSPGWERSAWYITCELKYQQKFDQKVKTREDGVSVSTVKISSEWIWTCSSPLVRIGRVQEELDVAVSWTIEEVQTLQTLIILVLHQTWKCEWSV